MFFQFVSGFLSASAERLCIRLYVLLSRLKLGSINLLFLLEAVFKELQCDDGSGGVLGLGLERSSALQRGDDGSSHALAQAVLCHSLHPGVISSVSETCVCMGPSNFAPLTKDKFSHASSRPLKRLLRPRFKVLSPGGQKVQKVKIFVM